LVSRRIIFWEVDAQVDFVRPDGKLYVRGAEKRLPNIGRLVDATRSGRVFLASDACVHLPGDEEFKRFPPHCLRGTPGASIVPEALAQTFFTIPNRPGVKIPPDLSKVQQVILEKQTLDVFDNPNTEIILRRLQSFTDPDAEFFVFGVVTEYCVRLVAKGLLDRGRRVSLVTDAIETLNAAEGQKALDELTALGAQSVTTEEALTALDASLAEQDAQQKQHKKKRSGRPGPR
jgi:nicotinamidase/pyrazinamidase